MGAPNSWGSTTIPAGAMKAIMIVLLPLLVLFGDGVPRAEAFFSSVDYATEDEGRREVLSFPLPVGSGAPHLRLLDAKVAQLTVPGVLALPLSFDLKRSRYVDWVKVEEIRSGEMGLTVLIGLKMDDLSLRGILDRPRPATASGSEAGEMVRPYRLLIEQPPRAVIFGPSRMLEADVFPGRDATLVAVSFFGNGTVQQNLDYDNHVLRLEWSKASLDANWRPVVPAGLVERVATYEFPTHVEMELALHPDAGQAFFYPSPESGTLVIELRTGEQQLGRAKEAQQMVQARLDAIQRGTTLPLDRLVPAFLNGAAKARLLEQDVDEAHFFDRARLAEQARQPERAMAYLDSLLRIFPDTSNREVLDWYRFELIRAMGWDDSLVLDQLTTLLSRYPNTYRYPQYRLLQMQLLNRMGQFESASAIMSDPNLPKGSPEVALERARTLLGVHRVEDAETALLHTIHLDRPRGDAATHAQFLLAKLMERRGEMERAAAILSGLTNEQILRLGNNPNYLMEISDLYYKNRNFPAALRFYAMLLGQYPKDLALAPWALLRSGDCRRHIGDREGALRIFDQLAVEFPQSESAAWGRIFKVQIETDRPLDERLAELGGIAAATSLQGVIMEVHITEATLRGDAGQHREAIRILNDLLALTSHEAVIRRAERLKRTYVSAGVKQALAGGRPEYAVLLAQSFGRDWRGQPGFEELHALVAEALMRLGIYDKAIEMLTGVKTVLATELLATARALQGELQSSGSSGVTQTVAGLPPSVSVSDARARLSGAKRMAGQERWKAISVLMEATPERLLSPAEGLDRAVLMVKADMSRGRLPEAADRLEGVLYQREIGTGEYHYWYATILQTWKGDDSAMALFGRVANEAKNREVQALAYLHLGDILKRRGKLDEAQEAYRKSAEMHPIDVVNLAATENALQLRMVQGATE
jgi:tetratricopeptide (TPR) repeat protein